MIWHRHKDGIIDGDKRFFICLAFDGHRQYNLYDRERYVDTYPAQRVAKYEAKQKVARERKK